MSQPEIVFTPEPTFTLTLSSEEAEYIIGALGMLPAIDPGYATYSALLDAGVKAYSGVANKARADVRGAR